MISAAIAVTVLLSWGPATAQSLFKPVARVNDSVITEWEVDQRARFLTLFRTPGDVREIAVQRLIEEQLQIDAAKAAGIAASPEAIEAGMAEFASRADLTTEQFIVAIGQGGVTEEAFRAFVRAGIVWRDLIRARFGPDARPTPADIDARLLQTGTEGGTRVLLNEIVLPASDPATAEASRARAGELSRITDEDEFRTAARRFSRAPTRINGGELEWLALTGLPETVSPIVANLRPGQTSRPIELDQSIVLFYMRDRQEVRAAAPTDLTIDYAVLSLGSEAEATRIAGRARTCDELYAAALRLPEDRLRRESVPEAAVPANIAAVLATLDPGETAPLPGSPGTFVMFCGRGLDTEAALNRNDIGNELVGQTLGRRAALLLAELSAAATISRVE